MDTWIKVLEAASPLITTVIGAGGAVQFLLTRHDKKMDGQKVIAEAKNDLLKAMAQGMIYDRCERAMEQGWIDVDEKAVIEDMYEPYTRIGGNHKATVKVEAMRKLPNK